MIYGSKKAANIIKNIGVAFSSNGGNGSTTITTDEDFINDAYIWVENVAYYSTLGYKILLGHQLIGKTVTSVQVVLTQQAVAPTGTSSVYIGTSSASTLIGSVENDELPAPGNNTTYSEFTGDGEHEVAENDIIFFQNNGSGGTPYTTGLRAGRWDNASGGYVVPNNIWAEYGDTQTCRRDDLNGGDGKPPPVVGNSTSGGKAIGMKVTYTD